MHESMIRSSRLCIYAVLKETGSSKEGLQSTFIGIESLMDSRPPTTVIDGTNDKPVHRITSSLVKLVMTALPKVWIAQNCTHRNAAGEFKAGGSVGKDQ